MFKQLSIIALVALALPSVFGDLHSFNGQSCGGVAQVHHGHKYCLKLYGQNSHKVKDGKERGWYIYPTSNCSGKHRYLVVPEEGCTDQYSYGFSVRSAEPYYG